MKSHAPNWKVICLPLCVVGLVVTLVTWASSSPVEKTSPPPTIVETDSLTDTVQQVDRFFEREWAEKKIAAASTVSELTQLRRLSLALHGTVPSLEEIREFESMQGADRLERWTQKLLADRRFAD
ncbi:MAG TPA: hypothetical protein DCY03_21470, partial [Planctomycetaceae bacterium]|nr:hypothetical protein [Planctomycetaceae bacterium]